MTRVSRLLGALLLLNSTAYAAPLTSLWAFCLLSGY